MINVGWETPITLTIPLRSHISKGEDIAENSRFVDHISHCFRASILLCAKRRRNRLDD